MELDLLSNASASLYWYKRDLILLYRELPEVNIGTVAQWRSALTSITKGATAMAGLSTVLANINVLGRNGNEALRTAITALQATTAVLMIYSAVSALRTAEAGIQSALAAIETTIAAANPMTWPNIAIAGTAAALTFAALQLDSGRWEFPLGNLANPADRERMARQAGSVL